MVSTGSEAAAEAVDPDEVIRFAQALIQAPSENPGDTEDDAAEAAGEILTSMGLPVEVIRSTTERPSLVAWLGDESGPRLAWNGHLDVVPAGDPAEWSSAPWDGEILGGRMIGRGACDMKGPIGSALAAVAAIQRAGVELGGTLVFHLVADEEHGGTEGTKVLFERGLLDQDACVVGEPSELTLALAERGGAWIEATANGKAAHGSQPERGVNAVTSMTRLLLRLSEALPDIEHPLVGRPTVNVGTIAGGRAPNMVPDSCMADIDRRTIPGEDDVDAVMAGFEKIIESIRSEHPEVQIDLHVRDWIESMEVSPDTPIAKVAAAAIESESGVTARTSGFTGITDARFYANDARLPTVIVGPGSLSLAHATDESVGVDELISGARVYSRIFTEFLGT